MMKLKGQDSREGILPLICCSVMMMLVSAGFKSQAVFFEATLSTMDLSREQAAWPMSIYQFSMNFGGLLLGPLTECFSIRLVTFVGVLIGSFGLLSSYFVNDYILYSVTFGLMGGLGFGAVMLAASILMTQYFDKYRAVTIGIAFAGGAVGSFFFPTLLSFLTTTMGFHAMNAINGAICSISIPFSLFLKEFEPEPEQNRSRVDRYRSSKTNSESRTSWSVLIEPKFWIITVTVVWYYWANMACVTTLIDYHKTALNFSQNEAISILTILGVAEFAGQLILPMTCDRGYMLRETLMILNLIMGGLMLIAVTFSKSYGVTVAIVCIFGPFYGLSATFYRSFVGDYCGVDRMKLSFGLIVAIKGACLLSTPMFIGYFRDVLHDYRRMYIVCGTVMMAVSAVFIPVIHMKRKFKKMQPSRLSKF